VKLRSGTVILLILILPPMKAQTPHRSLLLGGWETDGVGLLGASGIRVFITRIAIVVRHVQSPQI
jgi:hypothetical protein